MATVTYYHKLGGLKQYKFTLLHSTGVQKYEISFTGAKPRCCQDDALEEALGKSPLPCLF